MTEKRSLLELVKTLENRNSISHKAAMAFGTTMFQIIRERLTAGESVKVKGLGTFKVITVEPRESVNVNTGERLTIGSHQKITFTPDVQMKEIVNKPFSQFETVVLNEGVDFSDSEPELESDIEPMHEPLDETVSLNDPVPVFEPAAEPEQEVEPEPAVEPEPETVFEPEVEPESLEHGVETDDVSHPWLFHVVWLFVATALAALAGYLGYLYGYDKAQVELTAKRVAESRKLVRPVADTLKVDTVKVNPAKPDTIKVNPSKRVVDNSGWEKYDSMDARVRTGAYGIVGTEATVKVAAGETLRRITRRYLGEGMECYIEVYNGLPREASLKEGQILKIPKLKTKKSLRK